MRHYMTYNAIERHILMYSFTVYSCCPGIDVLAAEAHLAPEMQAAKLAGSDFTLQRAHRNLRFVGQVGQRQQSLGRLCCYWRVQAAGVAGRPSHGRLVAQRRSGASRHLVAQLHAVGDAVMLSYAAVPMCVLRHGSQWQAREVLSFGVDLLVYRNKPGTPILQERTSNRWTSIGPSVWGASSQRTSTGPSVLGAFSQRTSAGPSVLGAFSQRTSTDSSARELQAL
jgi:hypothetical protein